MGELGWAESTVTEQITVRRHQHAPAASIGAGDWYSSFAPQLHSTKKAAGELATSGCGSAAAGEKAACSTHESAIPRSRHTSDGRERQRPPTFAGANFLFLSVVVFPCVSVCGYPVCTQCVPSVATRVVAKIYRPLFS